MTDDVIYESANATVTRQAAIIREQSFQISEINEISIYDDTPKAKRWAWVGVMLSFVGSGISLLSGGAPGVSLILLLGGGALLIYRLFPTSGISLVISMVGGNSEYLVGLSRDEVYRLQAAIETAKSAQTNKG